MFSSSILTTSLPRRTCRTSSSSSSSSSPPFNFALPMATVATSSSSSFAGSPDDDDDDDDFENNDNEVYYEEDDNDESSSPFASDYHVPVMYQEVLDAMLPPQGDESSGVRRRSRILVDGTLGGGGHSLALLQHMEPGDILFGADVDGEALEVTSERLSYYMNYEEGVHDRPFFIPVQSNFCQLHKVLPKVLHPITQESILNDVDDSSVDALLLDLGVSSHQIDAAHRGFAFSQDGPLDMRMKTGSSNDDGITAADVCNEFSEQDLKNILKQYADEPRARSIARSIVEHRPMSTTFELREAVAAVTPEFARKGRRMGRTATLARVFQALRIVVNQEDLVLQKALEVMAPTLVNQTGGRLVILSYQSAEDRATKRIIRDGTVEKKRGTSIRDIYGNVQGPAKPWKAVGKRRTATEEEIALNSRARSASLRVAERYVEPQSESELNDGYQAEDEYAREYKDRTVRWKR